MIPIIYVNGRRMRNRVRPFYAFYGDKLVWFRRPPAGARIQIIYPRAIA